MARKNPYPDCGPYFPYLDRCPGCRLSGGKFLLCKQKKFLLKFLNFQLCFANKNFKQPNYFWLSMHAYRILLPSETDNNRFNSCEKHMLTDSVQPYNTPIIDLTCSVCTVKYIRPLFFAWTLFLRRSVHTKKPRSDISQYRPRAWSINNNIVDFSIYNQN
jgi:hypothetical protein